MAGYRVKRVATGDAAWSELQRDPSYGLLISDLVMPGHLQGAELARRVEATWPDMSLLLISGYPQEAAIEGNGVARRHPVLTKPVARADLLRTIDRLTNQKDPRGAVDG
jgi:CheY-like chemotaxis protein